MAGLLLGSSQPGRAEEPTSGLKAELFATTDLDALVETRVEPNIEGYWERGVPIAGVPENAFSIRWTGWLRPPKAGRYRFVAIVDDGVRLWIDGDQVMDRWEQGQRVTDCSLELTDAPHEIKVEYFEGGGPAYMAMHWQPPGEPATSIIPRDILFVTEEAAKARSKGKAADKSGLVADYFGDAAFRRKLKSSIAWRTEAIWADGAPQVDLPTELAARYTGFVVPPKSGKFKLVGYSDDGLRVWIDNKAVLECGAGRRKVETAFVEFEMNKPAAIKIEFVDGRGWGAYYLHWIEPDSDKECSIPFGCLFQSKAAANKHVSGE
jgi:hypothetical protein